MEMNFLRSKPFLYILRSLTFCSNRNLLNTTWKNFLEKESIFAIKSRKSCTIISFFLEISSRFLYFLWKWKSYQAIQHLFLKTYFKALEWDMIRHFILFHYRENQKYCNRPKLIENKYFGTFGLINYQNMSGFKPVGAV